MSSMRTTRWAHTGTQASADAAAAIDRRRWLCLGAGLAGALYARPAAATAAELEAAVLAHTGGTRPTPGRVRLEVAPLIDNGNAVPITVSVAGPLAAGESVTQIALFSERNPLREVILAHFGPTLGAARVSTRIRLATSQQLVAVARTNDGRYWSQSVDVIVTLAACLE